MDIQTYVILGVVLFLVAIFVYMSLHTHSSGAQLNASCIRNQVRECVAWHTICSTTESVEIKLVAAVRAAAYLRAARMAACDKTVEECAEVDIEDLIHKVEKSEAQAIKVASKKTPSIANLAFSLHQ